jgi:hypothetical protein
MPADPSIMARQFAGRQAYSNMIDQFRQLVASRLGILATAILDAKLSKQNAKN